MRRFLASLPLVAGVLSRRRVSRRLQRFCGVGVAPTRRLATVRPAAQPSFAGVARRPVG